MVEKINDDWITDRKPEPYVRVRLLYRNKHMHRNEENIGYYSTGKHRGYKTKTSKHIVGQVLGWKEI